MNALVYILLSMLDGIAIFTFAFGSFRVQLKDYWKEILMTNIVISIGTYYQRDIDILSSITPIINIMILIAALMFIFRISFLSSLRLSVFGFIAQLIFQSVVTLIIMLTTKNDFSATTTVYGFLVQTIGDGMMIALSLLLQKRKVWFTTLPYKYTLKFKLNTLNVIIFITAILGIIIMSKVSFNNFIISLLFWIVCFINLLLAEIQKEARGEFD